MIMPPVYIPNQGAPIDFDDYHLAPSKHDGLVCIGANFEVQTLINAYRRGLFPWYIHHDLPFWYSPEQRMVLYPHRLKISKSMQKILRRPVFTYSCDQAFETVIKSCARIPRNRAGKTWIDDKFIAAYLNLHTKGFAHSFEAWQGHDLVGGLYGVAIGQVFFGESMFAKVDNASKAAFIHSVKFLLRHKFIMIDCQMATEHLKSLGAEVIPRTKFLTELETGVLPDSLNKIHWTSLFDTYLKNDLS